MGDRWDIKRGDSGQSCAVTVKLGGVPADLTQWGTTARAQLRRSADSSDAVDLVPIIDWDAQSDPESPERGRVVVVLPDTASPTLSRGDHVWDIQIGGTTIPQGAPLRATVTQDVTR